MKNIVELDIKISLVCSEDFKNKLEQASPEELAVIVSKHCFKNNSRYVTGAKLVDVELTDNTVDITKIMKSRNINMAVEVVEEPEAKVSKNKDEIRLL